VTLKIMVLVLIAAASAPVSSAWSQVYQEVVTEVWVHDVPAPPAGDFWDPVIGNPLGVFSGRGLAGVYPDIMVCARPLAGGARTCTSVCWDVQGDTKLGGDLRSEECRRPLRVALPREDPRMEVDVFEMDKVGYQLRQHALIAHVGVTDPSACPHERPCEQAMPKGSLVLSFSIQRAGLPTPSPLSNPSPSNCEAPSTKWPWPDRDVNPPSGMHGPYASIEDAMKRDGAPVLALALTGTGKSEFGFLILRDRRQKDGGYYTTPPVRSSQDPNTVARPLLTWNDYIASWRNAITSACESYDNYIIVASVHTHPQCRVEFSWDVCFRDDSFSATDFNHAIKPNAPAVIRDYLHFEKILMINANDRALRKFEPLATDEPISASWVWLSDDAGMPWLVPPWRTYNDRVKAIRTYR